MRLATGKGPPLQGLMVIQVPRIGAFGTDAGETVASCSPSHAPPGLSTPAIAAVLLGDRPVAGYVPPASAILEVRLKDRQGEFGFVEGSGQP